MSVKLSIECKAFLFLRRGNTIFRKLSGSDLALFLSAVTSAGRSFEIHGIVTGMKLRIFSCTIKKTRREIPTWQNCPVHIITYSFTLNKYDSSYKKAWVAGSGRYIREVGSVQLASNVFYPEEWPQFSRYVASIVGVSSSGTHSPPLNLTLWVWMLVVNWVYRYRV